MNYFGLFFTFMLPGLVLGAMAATVLHAEKERKTRKSAAQKCKIPESPRSKLYVHSLLADAQENAA